MKSQRSISNRSRTQTLDSNQYTYGSWGLGIPLKVTASSATINIWTTPAIMVMTRLKPLGLGASVLGASVDIIPVHFGGAIQMKRKNVPDPRIAGSIITDAKLRDANRAR